jgi:hypothetical protein
VQPRIDINRSLPTTFNDQSTRKRIAVMRPVAFGEVLLVGTRLDGGYAKRFALF